MRSEFLPFLVSILFVIPSHAKSDGGAMLKFPVKKKEFDYKTIYEKKYVDYKEIYICKFNKNGKSYFSVFEYSKTRSSTISLQLCDHYDSLKESLCKLSVFLSKIPLVLEKDVYMGKECRGLIHVEEKKMLEDFTDLEKKEIKDFLEIFFHK